MDDQDEQGRTEALKAGEGVVGIKSKFSQLLKANFKIRGRYAPLRRYAPEDGCLRKEWSEFQLQQEQHLEDYSALKKLQASLLY